MVFKGIMAAATAVSLAMAPTVAAAQQATQSATQAASTTVAPATEKVDGSELRGGFIIPLVAVVLVILGVLALTNDDEDSISA